MKSVAIVLLVLVLLAPAAFALTAREVMADLMCTCPDCVMVSADCTCGTAGQMRQDVSARLARGESKPTILAAYVSRYGEKVLAAPPKRGFTLVAWLLPAVAVIASSLFVLALVRRAARSGGRSAETPSPEPAPSQESLARVDEELENLR